MHHTGFINALSNEVTRNPQPALYPLSCTTFKVQSISVKCNPESAQFNSVMKSPTNNLHYSDLNNTKTLAQLLTKSATTKFIDHFVNSANFFTKTIHQ